jgi:hypothetical protein
MYTINQYYNISSFLYTTILLLLKLNTFANFETPSNIDLSELFFGQLKGYVDFFCHFLLSVIIQWPMSPTLLNF